MAKDLKTSKALTNVYSEEDMLLNGFMWTSHVPKQTLFEGVGAGRKIVKGVP